jgi:hypothetical protein
MIATIVVKGIMYGSSAFSWTIVAPANDLAITDGSGALVCPRLPSEHWRRMQRMMVSLIIGEVSSFDLTLFTLGSIFQHHVAWISMGGQPVAVEASGSDRRNDLVNIHYLAMVPYSAREFHQS